MRMLQLPPHDHLVHEEVARCGLREDFHGHALPIARDGVSPIGAVDVGEVSHTNAVFEINFESRGEKIIYEDQKIKRKNQISLGDSPSRQIDLLAPTQPPQSVNPSLDELAI